MKNVYLLRLALSLFFVSAGSLHFFQPEFYLQIVPGWVPFPEEMIYVSGFCEIFLGVLALFPQTRAAAGWGLIALLAAVFPANLNMALHPESFSRIPEWVLWARLPFQGVFILWAWFACLRENPYGEV